MTEASTRGRLIALEGIDGCGKSTQASLLARALGALLTREPGGSALGRALRTILLEHGRAAISERAEALLMVADRAQHVAEVLAPALDAGRWVVTDRFSASTLAYQGHGRGLDLQQLAGIVSFATGDLLPDLTVLIDVAPGVARSRLSRAADRFESEGDDFQDRVAAGYRQLASADPDRWVMVDGSRSESDVAQSVQQAVFARLGRPEAES